MTPAWEAVSLSWSGRYQREAAALSEGFCPVHCTQLEAVATPARRIAGHCIPCRRFWGFNLDSEQVGWWLDHEPWHPERFSAAMPDWMGLEGIMSDIP